MLLNEFCMLGVHVGNKEGNVGESNVWSFNDIAVCGESGNTLCKAAEKGNEGIWDR